MNWKKKCLEAISKRGALLVYPLNNKKLPPSLWGELFPRSEMKWEWDQGADDRVSRMWITREELSRSGLTVYSKWYRGRATFFDKDDFVHLLRVLRASETERQLRGEAERIYEALCESSPMSTKALKRATELTGKPFESLFQKATKQLFEKGLIVGWGEVDDGAFPSLNYGATKLIFEDLWAEALLEHEKKTVEASRLHLESRWSPEFIKFLNQILSRIEGSTRTW